MGSHAWWCAHLYEAEAVTQCGDYAQAQILCDRVALEGNSLDRRISSWLRRIEAGIQNGLGDRRSAYRLAEGSLEILGDDAPPFHRIRGLLVAQQARPSRTRLQQIRALSDTLGWNSARRGQPSRIAASAASSRT
jgi:hypothetical protein